MKNKKIVQFDELDLKCLNEMPLIINVMSTTGNKVAKLLSSFYVDMNEFLKDTLNTNSNLEIGIKSYEFLVLPFISQDILKKIKIESFDSVFQIESGIHLIKKSQDGLTKEFWLRFGYFCCVPEEDEDVDNYFYFSIENENSQEKIGGIINDLFFYEKIKNKLNDYTVVVLHPEKEKDSIEQIYLQIEDFSIKKIQDSYCVFKESILTPFLEKLE
ncbi:MAG: hypothetical protein WBM13_10970 [Bacteroidia bacterium]